MKLQISSYNNGGTAYNAEAEETSFLSYKLRHRFNNPAEAVCVIADTNGTKAQKYNVDGNDVYVGPGKATIEHPDATDVFYGRIMKAEADSMSRTVTLYCQDWLSQLDDERVTYDMREDLDGSGLRQSTAHAEPDEAKTYLIDAGVRTLFSAQADDGGAFTDETAPANETTEDDMTLLPALPVANDAYYFGFETAVSGFSLYISQQGDWAGTMIWEYWDGAAWSSLTDGPSGADNTFESAGQVDYTWTIQGDETAVAVNGVTAYWVRARVNTFTAITTQPLGRDAWAEYYLYDNDMAWDTTPGNAQNFDDMSLLFTKGMAGKNSWRFFPFEGSATAGATYADNPHELWHDDDLTDRAFRNADFDLTYNFKVYLGHNDPSDFYVHSSITGARVFVSYNIAITGAGNHSHIQIDDKTDGYIVLDTIDEIDHFHRETFNLSTNQVTDIIDSDGIATIQFDVDRAGGSADLQLKFLYLELDVETTGYSSSVAITETEANRIRVSTDLTLAATRIWEGIPYCIVKPIYKHLDTAESVGLSLFTDEGGEVSESGPDPLVALTAAGTIEHTSGLSARQYKDMTRLDRARDLAQMDKAVFFITLGGVIVTWKSTFNDGAPTAMTDASVEGWKSVFDWQTVVNEYDVYGARIGDSEIYQNSTDATSIAKYGSTRTEVIRNPGLVAHRDAAQLGSNMATRDANVQQMLYATIAGLDSTYRLGTEVSITSTYLGLTTEAYIVYDWIYDSRTHKTNIVLHPRVSQQGLVKTAELPDQIADIKNRAGDSSRSQFIPEPVTNEVS